jgi:hypothetical protein
MPTFKFARNGECKKDTARYDFMESLANALITTDWENFNRSVESATTQFSGVTKKDQPFKGQRRKEPNKSNKWRNMNNN